MHWRILFLMTMLAPIAGQAAGDAALDRATLKGLKAVKVVIDTMDAELVKQGLSGGELQTRIEERLRRAGVPVDGSAAEFVGLRIMQVRDKKGPYALCISAGLYQPVVLVRDKDVKTATSTWEVENVVIADAKLVHEAAMDSVDELVDRFVAAWKSVK